MEQNKAQEEIYIKGFNHGYILTKEAPEVQDKIMQSKNSRSDYFQGLSDGGLQYKSEQFEQQLKNTRDNQTNRNKRRGR